MQRSGFPSHRRNQHPEQPGRTFRTQGTTPAGYSPDSKTGSRNPEMDYAREGIEAALARAGALYVHWRRFTARHNDGECPRCFYDEGRSSADPNCRVCWGSGWKGAYSRPSVQWMLITDTRTDVELVGSGFLSLRVSRSYSPAVPRISAGDVLAKLGFSNDTPYTADRYVVSDGVEEVRGRDLVDRYRNATDDHLDPEPEVVGYMFETSLIPENPNDRLLNNAYRLDHEGAIWLAERGSDRDGNPNGTHPNGVYP